MATIGFLRQKLNSVSLAELVRHEVEQGAVRIFKHFPGSLGFFLRHAIYKLLFKRLRGMTWVQENVTFVRMDRLSVGSHFGCNSGTYINAIGGIDIGDYVLLGTNVTISSGQHPIDGRFPPIFAQPTIPKKITIGNDVWIGANVVIMSGVTLAQGTVVGANSVVVRDTEPYAVVVGAPARLLRYRNLETNR